eukprot:gb/GFBE01076076.1/.p1 GENE.gb/GFBE01076076.1/~~gb/GFBE01076076.1/.p1  ORF type:complete len:372 (+),score=66.19 gb/GFBE01076076.1/:1-1116(+)
MREVGMGSPLPGSVEELAPTPPRKHRRGLLEPSSPSSRGWAAPSPGGIPRKGAQVHSPLKPILKTPGSSTTCRTDTRLLSTPTPKTTSSWSRTSIATPETFGGRSRVTMSPSPDGKGDSELELALELVNHVPTEVADRLIDRLRAAEAARHSAEERCQRAAASCRDAAEALDEDDEEVPLCCMPCLTASAGALRRALLCWSLLAAVLLGIAAGLCVAQVPLWALLEVPTQRLGAAASTLLEPEEAVEPPSRSVDKVCGLVDIDDAESADDLACEALLFEAKTEAEELHRRHRELQAGFGGALEAVSHWVAFLQKMVAADSLSGSDLEQQCVEAARPGVGALEALMPGSRADPKIAPSLTESLLKAHFDGRR